jgi:hypothetical protein
MSRLALYLLGPPRLALDGEPIHVGRRKAMALLAYLAELLAKLDRPEKYPISGAHDTS